MNESLTTALFAALATAGWAIITRALPWPESWLKRKPLACPACMTGWSAFAVMALQHAKLASWATFDVMALWFFCMGVAAPIFRTLYPPDIELPMP